MGYEQFFGLREPPFSLAPNPRYLFESASHAGVLHQLTQAIERREPLLVVTGEIGTGKTLLCRTVLQRLDRKTFVSVINDPLLGRDDLLKQMLQDFGVISSDRTKVSAATRHDLVHALEGFLSSLVGLNAHAVAIIDEAQHVQPDVLEQIRLLSNIDEPNGTQLQIILVGQLDLELILARPELRQFQQRVSRRLRLDPLAENELSSYIEHRLLVGRSAASRMPGAGELAQALAEWHGAPGAGGVTFTPDAVREVWRWSRGLPRVVNLLCDRALEAACAASVRTIDPGLVGFAATALALTAEPDRAPATTITETAKPLPPPPASPADTRDQTTFVARELTPTARRRPSRLAARVVVASVAIVGIASLATWMLYAGRSKAPGASGPALPTVTASRAASAQVNAPSPAAVKPPAAPAPERASTAAVPAAASPAAPSIPGSFEIIVASFRTEARASSVAANVTGAGLPVRQRSLGGWQQVIAGPFASREAADTARLRLDKAGMAGTQIVPTEQR